MGLSGSRMNLSSAFFPTTGFVSSKSLGRIVEEDELLFETPAELICPITHDIYREPVLNDAGKTQACRKITFAPYAL